MGEIAQGMGERPQRLVCGASLQDEEDPGHAHEQQTGVGVGQRQAVETRGRRGVWGLGKPTKRLMKSAVCGGISPPSSLVRHIGRHVRNKSCAGPARTSQAKPSPRRCVFDSFATLVPNLCPWMWSVQLGFVVARPFMSACLVGSGYGEHASQRLLAHRTHSSLEGTQIGCLVHRAFSESVEADPWLEGSKASWIPQSDWPLPLTVRTTTLLGLPAFVLVPDEHGWGSTGWKNHHQQA